MTNTPRDVFMHLLAVITLVVSAVSFGVIIFQGINVYIPDIVSDQYFSKSSHLSSMRSALATLVIVFPVFLWVSRFLKGDVGKFPEKLDLKIRKWLLYLTLFAAALVIIGDLVTLLRSFLEGELSIRFMLKVLTVLFISGSVLIHYLNELKEKIKEYGRVKQFDMVVIAVVIGGMVFGFFVAGTPQSQRLVRIDERKISDLQSIQWQIINYWQKKESLPSGLEDLIDSLGGFNVPVDPETGNGYGYKVVGDFEFELCAVFNVSSEDFGQVLPKKIQVASRMGHDIGINEIWAHDIGEKCFSRIIDPELYPPFRESIKQ